MLVNGEQGNSISVRDRGLLYGDGIFRTFRALHGRVLQWPLHYQKLQHDCTALGIDCPKMALLSTELDRLLVHHPDGVVKLIVTRGEGARGYAPPARTTTTHIWDVSPLPDYPAGNATFGIKARLCRLRLSHQPYLAGIKHLNRLENVLAANESNDPDIAEGLLMDVEDNVIEGTRSNLFLVSHGELITPELSRCGVAGVQRDRVIAWAAHHNMPMNVCDVGLNDILNAEELFVVSSIIGVWPIRALEQQRWNEFPISMKIRLDFDRQDA